MSTPVVCIYTYTSSSQVHYLNPYTVDAIANLSATKTCCISYTMLQHYKLFKAKGLDTPETCIKHIFNLQLCFFVASFRYYLNITCVLLNHTYVLRWFITPRNILFMSQNHNMVIILAQWSKALVF